MTGDEEELQEIVQIHENGMNIIRGEVHGVVMQFDRIGPGGVFGEGVVVFPREPEPED